MRRLALSVERLRIGLGSLGAAAIGCLVLAVGASGQSTEIIRPPGLNPLARGYEKLTPADKGGGSVGGVGYNARARAAVQGDALLFSSALAFAGAPSASFPNYYEARRGTDGWTVRPALPASHSTLASWYAVAAPGRTATTLFVDDSLSTQLVETTAAIQPLTNDGVASIFRAQGSSFELLTPGGPSLSLAVAGPLLFNSDLTPAFHASTPSGSHVLFRSGWDWPDSDELPSYDPNDFGRLLGAEYLFQASGGVISLVGVDEAGSPLPDAAAGSFPGSVRNAIAPDGSRMYYTQGRGIGTLYVREADSPTAVKVAESATFIAANSDGSRALYLAEGDAPGAYLYDRASDESTLISGDGNEVAIVAASDDLRRIYFAAKNYSAGPPVPSGVAAIYLYENGSVSHVMTMADDRDVDQTGIGSPLYMAPPNVDAWINRWFVAWTPDARTLVFDTTANVTGYESKGFRQVYRYDADTGQLRCLSCPVGPPTGDAELNSRQSLIGTHPRPMGPRGNVTRDGQQVFFHTPDALVPEDTNGTYDVYAAEPNGSLHLISDGKAEKPARFVAASGDGGDVYFATSARLLKADRDDLVDIYDARAGGGTPQSTLSEPPACQGDECQGPGAPPPPALNIGSVSFGADGNAPLAPDTAKNSVRVSKLRSVAGPAARLRVRVPGAGRISVTGHRVRRAVRSVGKSGTYTVSVRLRPGAKKLLRKRKRIRVAARVSYRASSGQSASKTVSVTFKQPKAKRAQAKKGGR